MPDDEWARRAAELVQLEGEIDVMEEAARAEAKARREQIRDLRGRARELRQLLERREIEETSDVYEKANFETGALEFIDVRTGEVVGSRDMAEREKQGALW